MNTLLDSMRVAARLRSARQAATPQALAAQLGLRYNGIQSVPGRRSEWVFTDARTGGSFHTRMDAPVEVLRRESGRLRAKFATATVFVGSPSA